MKRLLALIAFAAMPAPAQAGASEFVLVNGTETVLAEVVIRRAGTDTWRPLGAAPLPGANQQVKFGDPDCAFDIRANVAGAGPVTWAGVNLCDVKSVTLKSDSAAGPWVDYDAP
ncbi:MAG: hypothetical protein ACREBM_06195 [Sphingomicrobium sp.]